MPHPPAELAAVLLQLCRLIGEVKKVHVFPVCQLPIIHCCDHCAWLISTWKAYMIVVTPPNRTLLRVLSTLQVVFNALFKRTSQSAEFATRK